MAGQGACKQGSLPVLRGKDVQANALNLKTCKYRLASAPAALAYACSCIRTQSRVVSVAKQFVQIAPACCLLVN